MISAHIFLDGSITCRRYLEYCPRLGDTIRFSGEAYGKVTEVIWCLDEPTNAIHPYQRVNIRTEKE